MQTDGRVDNKDNGRGRDGSGRGEGVRGGERMEPKTCIVQADGRVGDKDNGRGVGGLFVLFVGCLTSQQHASVSQGRICTDNFTCCHTEIEAADQTFRLTQSQYTDTGLTSPSADPITPGAWQGSHWSANF